MCGIAGTVSFELPHEGAVGERMVETRSHRGPGAEGIHLAGPTHLAHQWLKILNLAAAGDQLMSNRECTVHVAAEYWYRKFD